MHTDYSLLDSCSKPEEYIELIVRDGGKAVSFSEHGKMLNWTEKWKMAKDAGLKYVHSVEIYLTEDLSDPVRDNYHTVLIAKNMAGLKELNTLVTKSCDKDHFYYTNRLSFDEFLDISDNVISTSACLGSPLYQLPEDNIYYDRLVRKYTFLEIQAHNDDEQRAFNDRLVKLSRLYNKPLIAGTDTHSSSQYKAECRAILLDAKKKKYPDDNYDLVYKTYDELVGMFERQGSLPREIYLEAIENTNRLADMVEEIELDLTIKYPIMYGTREEDSARFAKRVDDMFADKLARGVIPAKQARAFHYAIEEEMRVLKKLNMDGFMLSMSEIVTWAREQGFAIGTARGSVAGSRVAYVTDIIDLNPETWGTMFSRFANEDRLEIGDIDIDCVESDRPAIFKYITDRFGERYTARVASFSTLKEKAVIDEIGRALGFRWTSENEDEGRDKNPWSLSKISEIKEEYDRDPEGATRKYPELFKYMDGLLNTKTAQSVHPAGIIISPITLDDNFGVFNKDGESCLVLDMDNVHDFTGLAKYDFLVLKTVEVIQDACNGIGTTFPLSHQVNWDDQAVWESMWTDTSMIFQMESGYAGESMRKFKPTSIKEMSLVTAAIRPSGASYRDQLFARQPHVNNSALVDDMLKDNLGFLLYQEDSLRFLQEICGLSGSEADNVRRAIGRKQRDRLEAALPAILDGYCKNSPLPRSEAEEEAKEFLQILEDSADYQFGYNHSVAYCMLGYLTAYLRHHYPIEFITSFLNKAANDEDIRKGTEYANKVGISITLPRWGFSKSNYSFNKEKGVIAKGLSSIKFMSDGLAEEMFELSKSRKHKRFVDVLQGLVDNTSITTKQLDILIRIDFFSEFGNQKELLTITDYFYTLFNKGQAKRVMKRKLEGKRIEEIVSRYAVGVTKSGQPAASYTLLDVTAILEEAEDMVMSWGLEDINDLLKVQHFYEVMGYVGYVSGKDEDRRKLYITNIFPLKRKKDGKQFGYSILTKSIGSGVEARFTVFNSVFDREPVSKGSIILLQEYRRENVYFTATRYQRLY